MKEVVLFVQNELGIHARPASKIVELAGRFSADVQISRGGVIANAKSILGVLTLAAPPGTEILLRVDGADEDAAIAAFQKLFDEKFGE